MADISTVVDVSTTIVGGGISRLAFGRGLLITEDETIDAAGSGKVLTFSTLEDATARLPAGSAALDAATVWFSAEPRPQSLYVGRWASSDVATKMVGGRIPVAAGAAPLNSAAGQFRLGDTNVSVDLSSEDTYAKIAAAIQTKIQALAGIYAGATFAYAATPVPHFELTLTGSSAIPEGQFEDSTADGATQIAAALGMTPAASGYRYTLGASAESVLAAARSIVDLTSSRGEPVPIVLAADVAATDPQSNDEDVRELLSAWVEGTEHVFGLRETAAAALTPNDDATISAKVFAASRGRTAAVFTEPGELPDVALMARMSAMNLASPSSLITPHAKALPGVEPTDISAVAGSDQLGELQRKRVSVYTTIVNDGALLGGYCSRTGYWLDAIWWLIWLKAEVESAVFAAMRSANRLTRAALGDELRRVMQRGVRNGGVQPGRSVSATTTADIIQTTGNQNFAGVLESGWLVWVDPAPSPQDIADRIARFRIWVAGSEAIHRTFGDIRFEN